MHQGSAACAESTGAFSAEAPMGEEWAVGFEQVKVLARIAGCSMHVAWSSDAMAARTQNSRHILRSILVFSIWRELQAAGNPNTSHFVISGASTRSDV